MIGLLADLTELERKKKRINKTPPFDYDYKKFKKELGKLLELSRRH